MISTRSSSDQSHRNSILRIQPRPHYPSRQTLNVPVMQETLLLAELEAQEFCVDLRMLSEVILSDLGASLQVLRLAGRGHDRTARSPTRMEDCISDIGLQACIASMSAQNVPYGGRSTAIAELWSHSRKIARHAKYIAEQTTNLDPDQAYLVGLCHSIRALPAVLGWSGKQRLDGVRAGMELAREWSLPEFVLDYFAALEDGGGRSPWQEVVYAAHCSVGQFECEGASAEELHPQILWVT